MTAAVQEKSPYDLTEIPHILRGALRLGFIQGAAVALFSVTSTVLEGVVEGLAQALILLAGVAATTLLPGLWTRARTIEGIAGAAGVGFGATVVFLILDVVLLKPLGAYTHRWYAVGGGSTWWYHPVWWMAGTYLSWMGAWALAEHTARRPVPSPGGILLVALAMTAVLGAMAMVVRIPGAEFGLETFGVAFLPAIALTVLVARLGGGSG
jgi:hypothetical protein